MSNINEKENPIGGQAVLEGVMMKSKDAIAIAVRRSNGDIVVKRDKYESPAQKHKWMNLPIIRGIINMGLMLKLGSRTLNDSTEMLGTMEEDESKLEKWLRQRFGKKVDKILTVIATILGIAISVGLFIMLPNTPVKALRNASWSLAAVNLVSGFIRIVILIGYLLLCGLQKDLKRTFSYHGSEHKAVYCYENKKELTVENVQKYSTLHPRCGTSFLLITFILSIIFYSVLDQAMLDVFALDLSSNFAVRILSRLLMLPLIAGLSYEALRLLAKKENAVTKLLRKPGMQLQRLTTRQPSDDMCEIAICSLKAALYGLPEGETTKEGWVILKKQDEKTENAAS